MGQGGEDKPDGEEKRGVVQGAGECRTAHLDEQREARVGRALQEAVAGGPHVQRVSPALCHGAHGAKVLGNLGGQPQRREDTQRGGAGSDMLGRGGVSSPS